MNMYRTRDLWEEAFRVAGACKEQPELRKQVAFLWAKHLGGDSAMRLLNRLGLLDTAIDYATEHCVFDFAFELVRNCTPSKIAEVHSKYAMFLEDEGKLEDAEEEFIKVLLGYLGHLKCPDDCPCRHATCRRQRSNWPRTRRHSMLEMPLIQPILSEIPEVLVFSLI